MKNILLLMGGGSTEHEISLISAEYIKSQIDSSKFKVIEVIIDKDFKWVHNSKVCELTSKKTLISEGEEAHIDVAIPCIHGYPGETGDIQSYFELIKLPYLGCPPETSVLCFNKLVTKLLLELHGVKTTPFMQVHSPTELNEAHDFLNTHKVIYIKATNQGSSVGCYRVTTLSELNEKIHMAFTYSPHVILEKEIKGRELEVSAFEYDGKVHITGPGEIICPDEFYTYESKYSKESKTQTSVVAKDLTDEIIQEIKRQSLIAFNALKLRHLSRIDFFLSAEGEVFLNEVNTFPGHTNISMFPSMMKNYGIEYSDFINQHLGTLVDN